MVELHLNGVKHVFATNRDGYVVDSQREEFWRLIEMINNNEELDRIQAAEQHNRQVKRPRRPRWKSK